jgi:amino acid transporter
MARIAKKRIKQILMWIIGLWWLNPRLTQAQLINNATEINKQANALRLNSGFTANVSLGGVMAYIIEGFLALLGVIFIILIIIAGYDWMTARGEEEKVNKSKKTIERAIIGLLIIIAAYTITAFVFKNLPWGTNMPNKPY